MYSWNAKCQLLTSGWRTVNSWGKRPNMTIPWLKQSQPIFTECLYIIFEAPIPHYKMTFVLEKRRVSHEVEGGMEAPEDGSGRGCCGFKILYPGSITSDGVTECKSLKSLLLQPQPGRQGGKLRLPWERFPKQAGIFRSRWAGTAHCANNPIRDSTEQVCEGQGRVLRNRRINVTVTKAGLAENSQDDKRTFLLQHLHRKPSVRHWGYTVSICSSSNLTSLPKGLTGGWSNT